VPCHGEEGAADGKMARRLGYKPANLTLEQMSQLSDGEIFWKISKGRKPMPVFEQQLSQRERWDLVSYVRTLVFRAPSGLTPASRPPGL
jgi:mono/diheme cytochrome c family protein